MSNKVKIAIVALIIFFLGWGYIAKQQAENNKPMFTELRNPTAIRTAEVEREMQKECTKAFNENGERLNDVCRQVIYELKERGFKVIKYEDGTFEMRLDV